MTAKQPAALGAALNYLKMGLRAIPVHHPVKGGCSCGRKDCGKPGKHPCPKGWQKAETPMGEKELRVWWGRQPGANVGICTGEISGGLLYLDIDRHAEEADGFKALAEIEAKHGRLPETLTQKTGGGGEGRLFLADPADLAKIKNKAGAASIAPGLDLRVNGGQFVAPPSLHASGKRYEWVNPGGEIAKAPGWFVALCIEASAGKPRPDPIRHEVTGSGWGAGYLRAALEKIGKATEGTRNATLNAEAYTIGGVVSGGGLNENEARDSILSAALAAGLSRGEAEATISSGIEAGKAAPISRPATDLPDNLPTVLGYTSDLSMVLWANGALHIEKARSLRHDDLMLMTGVEDKATLGAIKTELVKQAHQAGLVDPSDRILPGIWKVAGRWVVISGKRAAEVKNGRLQPLEKPVVSGRIIEHGDAWLDWDVFSDAMQDGRKALWAAYCTIIKHVREWDWRDKDAAEYVAAFAMLTLVQQAMEWRPLLHLTGPRGSGKSSFFELVLGPLFGNLTRRMDKATAHSIAQEVGNSGRALILDEFEQHRHVGPVLALLKGSSSRDGGTKTSGTTGTRAHVWRIHHIPWCGSIYLPTESGTDAAIRDRFIRFELRRPGKNKPKPLGISKDQGRKLASLVAGGLIACWDEIEKRRVEIRSNGAEVFASVPGSDHRTLDNFCHASAVLGFLTGKPFAAPMWASKEETDDGGLILETIMSSIVRMPGSGNISVAEILDGGTASTSEATKELARNGVKNTTHHGVLSLAIKPGLVSRFLLKDTDYGRVDIDAPLLRLEGAQRGKVKWETAKTENCILIPWNLWNLVGTFHGTSQTMINKGLEEEGSKGSSENTEEKQTRGKQPPLLGNSSNKKRGVSEVHVFGGTLEPFPGTPHQDRPEEVPKEVPIRFQRGQKPGEGSNSAPPWRGDSPPMEDPEPAPLSSPSEEIKTEAPTIEVEV